MLSLILLLRVWPCIYRVYFNIYSVKKQNPNKNEEKWQISESLSTPSGSQQAKRGAEDSKGESGEEAAGGAASGASRLSFLHLSVFCNAKQLERFGGHVPFLPKALYFKSVTF